jgi:hypothetical protein
MKTCLSITTCKRLDLFLKTITSLKKYCLDFDVIDEIIHFDDSSSDEDRIQMEDCFKLLFPNTKYTKHFFEKDSFISDKRHMEIMKIWKQTIENNDSDFCFHIEDDWEFIEFFSISNAISVLSEHSNIALVGFSWEKKNFPPDFFIPQIIGDFWEWYYSDTHPLCDALMYDDVEMKYLPEGHWVKIINWPYFGFRPAIHDVKKLSKLETFIETEMSFELEFAVRFAKLYKSFLHINRICYHIGNEKSSYNLNESKR